MAIFGRRGARKRLREATRQALSVPVFAAPADYSPWITGGLWPAELSMVTAQTVTIAEQLRADLQRIVDAANAELNQIHQTAVSYAERTTEEERVVGRARHFAVQRVKSTVRQLGSAAPPPIPSDPVAGGSARATAAVPEHEAEQKAVDDPVPEQPGDLAQRESVAGFRAATVSDRTAHGALDDSAPHRFTGEEVVPATVADSAPQLNQPDALRDEAVADVVAPDATESAHQQSRLASGRREPTAPATGRGTGNEEPDGAAVAGGSAPRPNAAGLNAQVSSPPPAQNMAHEATDRPARPGPPAVDAEHGGPAVLGQAALARHAKPDAEAPTPGDYTPALDHAVTAGHAHPAVADADAAQQTGSLAAGGAPVRYAEPTDDDAVAGPIAEPAAVQAAAPPAPSRPRGSRDTADERLQLLLTFVARQEPGLSWVVGVGEDGTTVLTTDLASGWIPPDIVLPAGVRLLPPGRRDGSAAESLGATTQLLIRAPSDPLDWTTDLSRVVTSLAPRELPFVPDLGWGLREATHWRDGLPEMVNTLAVAGAASTGIAEIELALLRVHHDTAMYELLANYPGLDLAALLNALLLFATEAIASGDRLSANYHFSWFRELSPQR